MRLGILSDTHDELARMQRAIERLQHSGATALVHCGDLATPPIVEALSVLPSWFVFGNHDADMVPHFEQAASVHGVTCLGWGDVVELAGKKIGVAHGHLTTDIRRVLAEQPDYLLSGYKHYPIDAMRGDVRRITPGAFYRAEEFTVAVLNLATGELQTLRVD